MGHESIRRQLRRLIADEEAPTALEYTLMVAGVALVIIVAVFALGDTLSLFFNKIADAFKAF